MKTKSILLLLLLIASAMIQVFLLFVPVLILAMIQDQALVASKHFLVETENENLVDNAEELLPQYDYCLAHCDTVTLCLRCQS